MKRATLILAALFVAACGTTPESDEEQAVAEDDPIQDFIELHNLKKVTIVRGFENPGALFMEDTRYIIAYLRDEQWLIEYDHECRLAQIESGGRPNDKRRSTRALYVQQDTFRGCPMEAMYEITLEQAKELITIAKEPASATS